LDWASIKGWEKIHRRKNKIKVEAEKKAKQK
jgi:hypothetical protein